ncbi:hypothetical protein Dimus_035740, partial [Dionaea muscipula]
MKTASCASQLAAAASAASLAVRALSLATAASRVTCDASRVRYALNVAAYLHVLYAVVAKHASPLPQIAGDSSARGCLSSCADRR